MAQKIATNKLSIYLIKNEYTEHGDILKDSSSSLKHKKVAGIGTFYYGESHSFPPSWISKFFGSALGDDVNIFSASAKGLLLMEVKERIFALAFGYGWQFLRPGIYEERFGLKTALSIIDSENLRKIEKKNMVTVPKDTSEQLSKAGIAADFGIDIEQDLIRAITGKTIDEKRYGKSVTGKDSLSVSVKVELGSVRDFLKLCYECYLSNGYKKNFDWIDQISEIKDPNLTEALNEGLVDNLKNGDLKKTWMAVPELLDWEKVSGFKYSTARKEQVKDDIDIPTFLSSLTTDQRDNLDIDLLKRKSAYCIGTQNDEIMHHWNAFSCLYCEEHDASKMKTYLLSNGKWYEIESNFAAEVNEDFQNLRNTGSSIILPPFNHKNENEYNRAVAQSNGTFCCMDCNLINHGGAHSKIEFCDLMTNDKKFIHVKRYGASRVLSHLFFQGLISGELFLGDQAFREKVNAILPDRFKISDPTAKPIPASYEIIYGIISTYPGDLEIPFFSKVSIRTARRRLETFGYKVSLLKIATI